jgi:ABC-type sugar transport system permease subunit
MKIFDGVKKNYSKLERRDFLFAYLIVLFPVAQFLIFWFYVNVSSIGLAFQDGIGEFTWANFKMVYNGFTDQDMLGINLGESLLISFILWIVGEGIIFPITLITTYVLTKKIAGHYVFRVIYYIPGLMGSIIWTLLIKEMVAYSGPITKTLLSLGADLPLGARKNGLLRHEDTAFITLLTVRSIMGIVGNNAVLTGAYTRVPDELFESAELDGAGFWRTYVSVAIPCVWSTIATLMTFSLCSFVTADYNVFLFTNGNGSNGTATIGFLLYRLTLDIAEGAQNNGKPYYGYPAALGVLLTCITLPVVLIGRKIIDKIFVDVEV